MSVKVRRPTWRLGGGRHVWLPNGARWREWSKCGPVENRGRPMGPRIGSGMCS